MDSFFTTLDEFSEKESEGTEETKALCCDKIVNHVLNNGLVTCNLCGNTVSNIIDGPEWRFYGAK